MRYKNALKKHEKTPPGNILQKLAIYVSIVGAALSLFFAWKAVDLTIKYGESAQKVEDLDKIIDELIVQNRNQESQIYKLTEILDGIENQNDKTNDLLNEIKETNLQAIKSNKLLSKQNRLQIEQIDTDKKTTRPLIKIDSIRFNRDQKINLTFFNITCRNYGIRRGSDIYLNAKFLQISKDSLIISKEFEHKNHSVWIEPGESEIITFESTEYPNEILKNSYCILINIIYSDKLTNENYLYKRAYKTSFYENGVLRIVGIDANGIALIENIIMKN